MRMSSVCLAFLLAAPAADAGIYQIEEIATNTGAPYISLREPVINEAGTVAFRGIFGLPQPFGSGVPGGGIFVAEGGTTTSIRNSFTSPDETFRYSQPSLADDGTVAFSFVTNGALTLAAIDPAGPGGFFQLAATATVVSSDVDISDAGDIIALRRSSQLEQILLYENALTALNVEQIADTSGVFDNFSFAAAGNANAIDIADTGEVAFVAGLDAGGEVIVLRDGASQVPVIDTTGDYSNFSGVDINNAGQLAFSGRTNSPNSEARIVALDGGSETIVVETGIDFSFIDAAFGFNDLGEFAFLATDTNGVESLLFYDGQSVHTVFDTTMTFDGTAFTDLRLAPDSLNNAGQISFLARNDTEIDISGFDPSIDFDPTETFLFVATPSSMGLISLPGTLPMTGAALAVLAWQRRRRIRCREGLDWDARHRQGPCPNGTSTMSKP